MHRCSDLPLTFEQQRHAIDVSFCTAQNVLLASFDQRSAESAGFVGGARRSALGARLKNRRASPMLESSTSSRCRKNCRILHAAAYAACDTPAWLNKAVGGAPLCAGRWSKAEHDRQRDSRRASAFNVLHAIDHRRRRVSANSRLRSRDRRAFQILCFAQT
jgi:hypothetical protein